MEREIIFYRTESNYVFISNEVNDYELYSGVIRGVFNIEKLLTDEYYYKMITIKGYTYYEKSFWDEKDIRRVFNIPLSKNFIKEVYLHWQGYCKESIVLSNDSLNDNVESFYEFSLELEIEGLKFKFNRSMAYGKAIYISRPKKDEKRLKEMTTLFGEPITVPENESDKYGRLSKDYIVPLRRIDKIIGIKRYRDISSFGQQDGEQFTGEVEEMVLDLHHFDENIYNIFKEHGMLEINCNNIIIDSKCLKAKELFYNYDGNKGEMMKEELLEEYLSYNISHEMEQYWIDDLFFEKYRQLDINDANSLIVMSSLMNLYTRELSEWFYMIRKYVIDKLDSCVNTKGVKRLVDSTLENLHKVDGERVEDEIKSFEELKKLIRIKRRKIWRMTILNKFIRRGRK